MQLSRCFLNPTALGVTDISPLPPRLPPHMLEEDEAPAGPTLPVCLPAAGMLSEGVCRADEMLERNDLARLCLDSARVPRALGSGTAARPGWLSEGQAPVL